MSERSSTVVYRALQPGRAPVKRLVAVNGGGAVFEFTDRIEVGRYHEGDPRVGVVLVKDPTVSSRHCVIVQEADGRCFVRDTSRNGTRLEGRRLSPNSKTAFEIGQVLSVGGRLALRLDGTASQPRHVDPVPSDTLGISDATLVTNLVGDIRNFTTLVRLTPSNVLQASVSRVFACLEQEVARMGGTLKEFQGDSIFAFWERGTTANHAADACRAALALLRVSRRCAQNPEIWAVGGHPLEMDFALTTGMVSISGYGSENILSLSVVGESVVLAFRIEKIAGRDTGPIVACPDTRFMAQREFEFRDLGPQMAKGFTEPQQVYALVGERTDAPRRTRRRRTRGESIG